jgi:hypothetical protein
MQEFLLIGVTLDSPLPNFLRKTFQDLVVEQRFHIAATVRYVKNHHVLALDAVIDEVLACGNTP